MKDFILPVGGLFLVAVIVLVIVGAQAGASFLVRDSTKLVDKVTCVVNAIHPEKNYVRLDLGCRDKFAYTEDAKTVASYVNNPGLLTCTLYKSGSAICEPHKK